MLLRILSTLTLTALVSNGFTSTAIAQQQRLDSFSGETNELTIRQRNFPRNQPQPTHPLLRSPQPNSNPNDNNSFSYREKPKITIPKFSAITTTFCSDVKFNHEQASSFPVTLSLARPIMDNNGNVIAPINSLVSATVDANGNEIKIQPNALVIGGRYIPIETEKVALPALTDTRRSFNNFSSSFDRGQRGVAFRVTDNLIDWLALSRTNSVLEADTTTLLGFGLSVATGIAQGLNEPDPPDPEESRVMEIREGIQLIFPLKASVELPPMPNRQSPYFSERPPAAVCQDGEVNPNQNQFTNNQGRNEFNDETD